MRSFRNAAIGLIAAAGLAAASDVTDLTADTFKSFVNDNDLVLAEFFAPWCGHCKALAPEYEEAATTLKEKNIRLAKVDCTEHADLCKEYGVEGYPTLKVFRGEESITPYGGQRKAPAIISYMTKQALPAVSDVTTETLEEFKAADKVVLVAFLSKSDAKSNETFTKIAEELRDDFLFGASNDEELAKAEGVSVPGVVLYKQFDEGKNVYKGKFNHDDLTKFTKTSSIPLIGEVGPETYAGYMSAGIPLAYIFAETPEEREQLAKDFKPIAEKHKGKLSVATIDAKAFGQHAENLNLKVGEWPAFAIQNTENNKKYVFQETGKKVTAKAVGKFVDDFVAGKVEPSIKSEPIPEKQEGPVTVIVAHNYDDIVLDEKKDVLVEFYAPWCGHCKALAPKYDELATRFAGSNDKVTIAKVDATANDVPIEIQGFPTIKLFPAGDKSKPVDYTGSRTVDDLAQFITDNGTNKAEIGPAEEVAEDASSAASSATSKMAEQAAAATEGVKNAAEAVKEAVDAAAGGDDHDEL